MSSPSRLAAVACVTLAGCSSWELVFPTNSEEIAGITLLSGGVSNAFVVPLADGALVVDTKLEPFTDDLLRHLDARDLSPRRIVLTHAHRDHAEGLPRVLAVSAPDRGIFVAKPLADAWPDSAPDGVTGVPSGAPFPLPGDPGEPVELYAFDHAHTGGDVAVWLADRSVLLTGDLFQCGYHPHAERDEGGSWAGLTAAIRTLAALRPLHVIGGHGTRCGTADLDRYLSFLESLPTGSPTDPGYREFWILGTRTSSFEQARDCARFEATGTPWSEPFTLAGCGGLCVQSTPTTCR